MWHLSRLGNGCRKCLRGGSSHPPGHAWHQLGSRSLIRRSTRPACHDNVEAAYLLTLSRKPTEAEMRLAAGFRKTMPFKALAQVLLSSDEFLCID